MILNNASYAYFGLFLSVEMQRLGHLGTLFTNLPYTRLRSLAPTKYRSQPLLAAPMVLRKLGFHSLSKNIDYGTTVLFDRWVSEQLTSCDVFHCFSSFGLQSFEAAQSRFGALTIVERGSSHIRVQDGLLREEHARWGIQFRGADPRMIEREEREYETCDRITVQSTFAERTFLDSGIAPEKLIKLPLGVDVGMFHPIKKVDDTFRVLYAGSCSLRKGLPYLLHAISSLRLPKFEFVINGSINEHLRDLMRKYAHCYRFVGFQPLHKLHEVYSQASVLVLPTIEDGFAKVVTEAMACGVPVIATDHCGAPDVLTDGVEGFIVPIRSPEAIREKILYLYENSDVRDAMGHAAIERARTVNSLNTYGERAALAYKRALAAKAANAAGGSGACHSHMAQ